MLDFAGKYAKTTLETHNSDVCQICSLTPDKLKEHGVNSKYVDVQPVSIDWISVFAIGFAGLYDILDRVGRACAVHGARDFSAQHKVVRLPGKGLYERIRKITEEKK